MLSVNEAAGYLGVSRWTVYRLIRTGEVPALRVGERLRIPIDELRASIERRRVTVP